MKAEEDEAQIKKGWKGQQRSGEEIYQQTMLALPIAKQTEVLSGMTAPADKLALDFPTQLMASGDVSFATDLIPDGIINEDGTLNLDSSDDEGGEDVEI